MKKGQLTAEAVGAKLLELHGNMAAVARHFGVRRQSVWCFCKARPSLEAVAADCRESMKDNAESALYAAVLRGEAWAVCFYLKCQAKDRGYVERLDLGGGVEVRQRVVEEEVDAAGDGPGAAAPGATPVPAE